MVIGSSIQRRLLGSSDQSSTKNLSVDRLSLHHWSSTNLPTSLMTASKKLWLEDDGEEDVVDGQ